MYNIPGIPIPLKRTRIAQRHVYDPQRREKDMLSILLRTQHTGSLLSGPLCLDVTFFMPIPNSWSTKKKSSHLGQPHHSKPDLDNLLKFVCDICTGIIYTDDAALAHITAQKVFALIPSTQFTLRELTNAKNP